MDHDAHDFVRLAEAAFELVAVLVKVDGELSDAGFHGGVGNSEGFPDENSRIERLGDDVLRAKLQSFDTIGAADGIRHILTCERGEGVGGGQFHFVVDSGGAHIERAAEDERKTEDVVDLVGIVDRPVATMASGRASRAVS